jgi:tetratricopeptide (TPR) repeat protein
MTILCAACLVLMAESPPDPNALLKEGRRLAAEEPAKAAELFEQFLKLRPKDARRASTLLNLALTLERLGKHEQALKRARQVPDGVYKVEARAVEGRALLALGKHGEAEALLQAWLKEHGRHALAADATLGRALALNRLKRYKEAHDLLKGLAAGARVSYERGLAEEGLGRHAEAAASFKEARAEKALAADAGLRQGRALIAADRDADAAAVLEPLASAKTAEGRAAAFLAAACRERMGDPKAGPLWEMLVGSQEQEHRLAARLALGEAARVARRWDAAAGHYAALRKEAPTGRALMLAARGQGLTALGRGQKAEALAFFREAAKVRCTPPDEAQAEAGLHAGVLLRGMLRPQDAIGEFDAVAGLPFPRFATQALFHKGECLEGLGRQADAVEAYRAVVKQFPRSRSAEMAEARIAALSRGGCP